jgi:hypothetical protein
MRHLLLSALLGTALLALIAPTAAAEELTVKSISAAQQSGATADGIIAMVNNPANTIAVTAEEIITLRSAGIPESVLAAIWARIPAPVPAASPLQPDDPRLVELVRLINSGLSDSIIAEQIRQSGQAYNLSVNDLIYLKQSGAQESTITALMAVHTGAPATPGAAPAKLDFGDLILVTSFLRKHREGRLVMEGDTMTWEDRDDPKKNFTFQVSGLEKVWFTCEARTPENFCYQINFAIVRGEDYSFRDSHRKSGSNASVTRVMEALRTYFPRLVYGAPEA